MSKDEERNSLVETLEERLGVPLSTLAELLQQLPVPDSPKKNQEKTPMQELSKLLHEMGIPAHILGYKYLRTCILEAMEHPDLMDSVTQKLYPTIAAKFDTTARKLERGIRHAIEVAWGRGNMDTIQEVFGYTVSPSKGKPTNSEFIFMMVEYLQMHYDKSLAQGQEHQ